MLFFFDRFYSRYSAIFPMPKSIFFPSIFEGKSDVNDSIMVKVGLKLFAQHVEHREY